MFERKMVAAVTILLVGLCYKVIGQAASTDSGRLQKKKISVWIKYIICSSGISLELYAHGQMIGGSTQSQLLIDYFF